LDSFTGKEGNIVDKNVPCPIFLFGYCLLILGLFNAISNTGVK
jgi:hypothetical protein